jgi:outer membrane protein OmpA-like peptidoglycan-associated protein
MMTLRAGRCAFTLGFAALCGIGGSALPAAAQSYLADNGSNVTVDYSVIGLGAGPGPVTRGALPGSAMPAGSCSCADAPMGVIAAPPRPTFTNPFNAQVTQAPAVPPGFTAYSQIAGSSGGSGAVVLREPSAPTQMASSAAAPVEEAPAEPLPATTETQSNAGTEAAPAEPTLPATTQTQSESSKAADQAAASTGDSAPPAEPETMPTEVPSPVEQPAAQAPATPTPTTPAESTPAETETAEATPETPAAASAATSATTGTETQPEGEQQAAVAPETPPAAPAEGTTPPAAEGAGALPAGAVRIVYASDAGEVPADSSAQLDTIAQDMLANQDKRIQVLSYAAGSPDNENKARRKSLERGLAIRSYLMKAGVPSTRIDVRALGNKTEGGPADRVDIIPAS